MSFVFNACKRFLLFAKDTVDEEYHDQYHLCTDKLLRLLVTVNPPKEKAKAILI